MKFGIILGKMANDEFKEGDAYLRRAPTIVVDRIVDDFIGFHWDMIHTPCALGLLRVLEKNMRDDFSLAKTDETCIECAS